jgi:hypothetical protein
MSKAYATYLQAISPAAVKKALAYSRERGLGLTAASIRADATNALADAANALAAKLRGDTL